eukprot:12016237-Alexandrium_andersonii.AAC.1
MCIRDSPSTVPSTGACETYQEDADQIYLGQEVQLDYDTGEIPGPAALVAGQEQAEGAVLEATAACEPSA